MKFWQKAAVDLKLPSDTQAVCNLHRDRFSSYYTGVGTNMTASMIKCTPLYNFSVRNCYVVKLNILQITLYLDLRCYSVFIMYDFGQATVEEWCSYVHLMLG